MERGFFRYAGREENAARPAVIADLIELTRRQPRIDDDRPGVVSAGGEQQTRQRDAVFAHDHHAVAGPYAQRGKRVRSLPHRAIEFAIAQGRTVLDQRKSIRRFDHMPIDHLMDTIGQSNTLTERKARR